MLGARDPPEIGYSADIPEKFHIARVADPGAQLGQARQRLQRMEVVGFAHAGQQFALCVCLKRGNQPLRRSEVKPGIAPLQPCDRVEAVFDDGLGHLLGHRAGLAGDAEAAILGMAPGAARDLGQFVRPERAHPAAVEFRQRREGHMLDVEIEPHADGVGRDQVIDIAILVERDLGVPGPGRQRPHHHRAAALLAPDQLGDGIDVLDREADDGRAGRHPADLFRARVDQLGESLAAQELGLGYQRRDGIAHRLGAQKQRLVLAAGIQQAVGEDMAAFGIGTKLDLVDGQKVGAGAFGHRLDRRHPVLRALGHDPLLAGDERHHRRPAQGDDPVIDLARQQAQRQADHAGAVGQHPLDRVMGLAGIGGPEDRGDPRLRCHPSAPSPVVQRVRPEVTISSRRTASSRSGSWGCIACAAR